MEVVCSECMGAVGGRRSASDEERSGWSSSGGRAGRQDEDESSRRRRRHGLAAPARRHQTEQGGQAVGVLVAAIDEIEHGAQRATDTKAGGGGGSRPNFGGLPSAAVLLLGRKSAALPPRPITRRLPHCARTQRAARAAGKTKLLAAGWPMQMDQFQQSWCRILPAAIRPTIRQSGAAG